MHAHTATFLIPCYLPAGTGYADRVAQDYVSRRAHRRSGSSAAKLLVAHSQGNAGARTALARARKPDLIFMLPARQSQGRDTQIHQGHAPS